MKLSPLFALFLVATACSKSSSDPTDGGATARPTRWFRTTAAPGNLVADSPRRIYSFLESHPKP